MKIYKKEVIIEVYTAEELKWLQITRLLNSSDEEISHVQFSFFFVILSQAYQIIVC
jgi:hypothetical protein